MSSVRARVLRAAKSCLHLAMRRPLGEKVLTLVAQERDVARSARAHARHHDALLGAVGRVVRRGPFAGMIYASANSTGSALAPKLLGSYECELHSAIGDLVGEGAGSYDLVIDIGAAEGFYAVGLARLVPDARVIAYELQPNGRALLAANAAANGVAERVDVRGTCTPDELDALATSLRADGRVLIVSDCEGAEYTLLDGTRSPAVQPLLSRADILLELHGDSVQTGGASPRDYWAARLADTHNLRWIDVAGRDPAHYPELAVVPFAERLPMLFERTDVNGWLVARPRRTRVA
jgi:hypothetical protein